MPYSTKFWWGKTLANQSFQSVGEEMLATLVNLGKILPNDVHFAKFTKVFPHHNFALYSNRHFICIDEK